ncbi:hypothetical protein [Caldimonas brevitalea]|uniref:Uncharacterized protein n=1 Tax=Caldimonas brevitalea TaxID=413882 RepID=A0A0G3BGE7_9BURK|nr:hypothetical protein [Caldimonas brevitalea]AKJ28504.1 hypothetical protein AAW51_1813 [Caldimonas brevitalea]
MSYIICEKHGGKIGEQVSRSVRAAIMGGEPPRRIIPVTLRIDDLEIPSYIGEWEVEQFEKLLEAKLTQGKFFDILTDEKLDAFLETTTVVCMGCLKDYLARGNESAGAT